MTGIENPALKHFAAQLRDELALAQVLIRRTGQGYELRHMDDRDRPAGELRTVKPPEARGLAQYTAAGAFRPLKSAPNLSANWRMPVAGDAELETALNSLYPGAIADWHAVQAAQPPVTNFREYTARQSGMYRITAMLDDAQATDVIREGCDKKLCLKRRFWTVSGLAPDAPEEKSLIPCLEPCAVLLEFARKTMRLKQAENSELISQNNLT